MKASNSESKAQLASQMPPHLATELDFVFKDVEFGGQMWGHLAGKLGLRLAIARLHIPYTISEWGLLKQIPRSLYTFGSPRVGNGAFVEKVRDNATHGQFRFVDNNDLVTRVPPALLWYSHGPATHIDSLGSVQDSTTTN